MVPYLAPRVHQAGALVLFLDAGAAVLEDYAAPVTQAAGAASLTGRGQRGVGGQLTGSGQAGKD